MNPSRYKTPHVAWLARANRIRDQIKRAYEYSNTSDALAKRVSDHEKGIINFGRI